MVVDSGVKRARDGKSLLGLELEGAGERDRKWSEVDWSGRLTVQGLQLRKISLRRWLPAIQAAVGRLPIAMPTMCSSGFISFELHARQ